MNQPIFNQLFRTYTFWLFKKPRKNVTGTQVVMIVDYLGFDNQNNDQLTLMDWRDYGPTEKRVFTTVMATDFYNLKQLKMVEPIKMITVIG